MKAESPAPGSGTSTSELAIGEQWLARTLEDVEVGASPRQVLGRLDDRRVCLVVVAPGDEDEQWASYSAAAARRARVTGDRLLPVVASARSDGVFCVAYDIGEATPYSAHRETIEGSTPFCLQLLWGVARALDQLTEAGYQPTELTPDSVFVHGTRGAQLADLGVAREALGNPPSGEDRHAPWIAPEILEGEGAAERSAVYSFGALMYTMLTGSPPHGGTPEQIVAAAPPSLRAARPDLPEALDLVVSAAMARDPRQRYRTASEARSVAQIVLQSDVQSEKSSFLRGLRFKRSSTPPPTASAAAAPTSAPAPPEQPAPAPPKSAPRKSAPQPADRAAAPPATRAPARPPATAVTPPAPAPPDAADDDILVQRERERAAKRQRERERAAKRERERAYRQKRANELAAKRDQERTLRERRSAELAAERERERVVDAVADAEVAAEREQQDLARAKSEAEERARRAADRERRRETREGRAERRRERRATSLPSPRERRPASPQSAPRERVEPRPARQQSTVASAPAPVVTAPAPVVAQPAVRRPPRRALPLTLIGLALAAGAVGGVLLGGSSNSPAPQPKRLSTAAFGLTLPAGWEGSSPGRGRAEAHPADDARSGLTLALSEEPIERAEQANPVQLGRLEAWREPGVELPGARRAVRYVVPTETGKLVAICRASSAAAPDTLAQCERAASTLRLSSATGLPLAAVVEQQERWQAEVERLNDARAAARRKLAGAERPAGQLLAAEALMRVHERGTRRFAALPGGETVSTAARRTAAAYGALARAAGGARSTRWNAARERVRRAEADLRRAIASP